MRRRLLVVRAGDSSLHPQWLPASGSRTFDLFVLAYGNYPEKYAETVEYFAHCSGLKFDVLHAFISGNYELITSYDYVGFPDDDIAAISTNWDQLFNIMEAYQIDIGQASLIHNGNVSRGITGHVEGLILRWTDFVEVMMPVFSRRVLRTAWETFQHSGTGWGLDFAWQKLYPYTAFPTAIIDAVQVAHTRHSGKGDMYVAAARAHGLPLDQGAQVAKHHLAIIKKLYGLRNTQATREHGRVY